ncbi:MAG: PEP-CTERM sorting domain-containing protein [Chthoniobacterales bacterium]
MKMTSIPFAGLALATALTLSFGNVAARADGLQNNSQPVQVFAQPLPDIVVPADTFNIAIVGQNTVAAFLVSPLTATFGITQMFPGAGMGGQTVTVTSSESFSGANTIDTITISVPTNFVPAGTTIGGNPVTAVFLNLGGFNAGTNTLDFATPVVGPTYTGSIQFSGGTFALDATTNTVLTNGGMSLRTAEGVNAGPDASAFAIRSFTFTATYATVPEPSSFALGAFGAVALLLRKKLFRRRA